MQCFYQTILRRHQRSKYKLNIDSCVLPEHSCIVTTQQGPLNDLLPEIYPIIAAHLPLYATPSTLLALALTNHHISEIVLPLVYSTLVLKNETDALLVLQKLVDDPPLGRIVRELHIMSDLSVDTQNQDPPSDVIRRVEDVVSRGYLPSLHTLGLHLTNRWYYGKNFEPVRGFGRLRKEFCVKLKEKCPRLRGLILKGLEDDLNDPWLEESGFLQVPKITNLGIKFSLYQSGGDKLLGHISSLAPSLHTLDLNPRFPVISDSSILELNFPFLRSLSLASFSKVNTVQAMTFFERHPSIEYLNVARNRIHFDNPWFTSYLPQRFLPNLRHLKASWSDVRLVTPILDQLLSLSIEGSINAQIPYLLRIVLPNGLPNLKGLDMGQMVSPSGKNNTIEGSLWYESRDGTLQRSRTVFDNFRTVFDFMHSIARAAPNLEELGFHGSLFPLSKFVLIASDLNGFPYLKRLYYEGHCVNWDALTDEERATFSSQARDIAEAVPGLVSITNVKSLDLPYLTARISRERGKVAAIEVGKGYGMKIGYENEAFPQASPFG